MKAVLICPLTDTPLWQARSVSAEGASSVFWELLEQNARTLVA